MAKYKVIVSKHVAEHLLEHVGFISNASLFYLHRFQPKHTKITFCS